MFRVLTLSMTISISMGGTAFASPFVGFEEPMIPISGTAPKGVSGLSISIDSLGASPVDVNAARHAGTMGPEILSLGRSAASVNVYKVAAPSVVVVVSEDGFGSGVLISNGGDIVTNLHVVGNSKTVGIVFKSESESLAGGASSRSARVVKIDRKSDLAIVRVDSVPLGVTPLRLGGVSEVMVGADVHAIGHPTGNTWTYTRGYVSAIRRGFTWNERHEADVIQTQTPINPGNSGGPLLNNDGAVVGINSFKQASSDGLNFAVAADHVRSLMLREEATMKELESHPSSCKESPRLRNSSRNEKDRSNVFLYDINCDEASLFEIKVPDDKKTPISWRFDRNRDKVIDVIIFDEGHDGTFDFSYHDVDFDRKWDLIGYHPDGKMKPTRFVKYNK